MDNNIPLISVIISAYNSEKFIETRLLNLINQTIFDKIEVIIIDSGSMQNEQKIVMPFLTKYSNIRYFRTEERESIYKAWNRGIRLSKGEFITNANCDDMLVKDALHILSKYLQENPRIALVYGDQYITHTPYLDYYQINDKKLYKFPDFNRILQLEYCLIGSQPLWRSSLHFEDNIWFNEKYEICGDHEFELNISQYYEMYHIKIPLGSFYKSVKKENKEYQNSTQTLAEGHEISEIYTQKYINDISVIELHRLKNDYGKWIKINPILAYALKKILEFFRGPYILSFEFLYHFNVLILIRLGELKRASIVCQNFLRYKKSDKINKILNRLKQECQIS